jgi:hypothetical protein
MSGKKLVALWPQLVASKIDKYAILVRFGAFNRK